MGLIPPDTGPFVCDFEGAWVPCLIVGETPKGYTVEYHLPEGPGETLICDCVPEDDTEEGNI